jgi:hypothetical protein
VNAGITWHWLYWNSRTPKPKNVRLS